ncbi:hypothetical protein [Catellatospora citrea]|uniref:Uncharacterized protein n=1 Tax=Catellatospora citrea TaxID=53366 RepID=A0A8J3KR48_9ACTN|nr:hypothetical protein [Catellatospora citrea]RKE08600.1 hypothetical protein C8E86_3454 [Catellatospora citrea]GIG01671.1 hypothetical protein Cci01nite_67640 [Catellatospora citrea]
MTIDDLRTRLTEEYRPERLTVTVADIRRRAERGRRRRTAWAAAGVAAATIGVLAWPQGSVPSGVPLTTPQPSADAWSTSYDEQCRAGWAAHPQSKGAPLPALRFDLRDKGRGLRIYTDGELVVDCARRDLGTPAKVEILSERGLAVFSTAVDGTLADAGDGLPRFAGHESLIANGYDRAGHLVGRAPSGTVRVDAVEPDGTVRQAQLSGGLFLLWAPDGGLTEATVRAYTADRVIMETPMHGIGDRTKGGLAEICADLAETALRQAGLAALPPRRFTWSAGEQSVLLYAGGSDVLSCRQLSPYTVLAVAVAPAGTGPWQPMRSASGGLSGRGWLIGRAPDGAVSGVAVLPDGTAVPLELSGGWFGAWWPIAPGDFARPVRVEVTTATAVWTEQGGQVTQRPR